MNAHFNPGGRSGSNSPVVGVIDVPSVRILILGDSGVGKSSLLHLICNGQPSSRALPWTVGCSIEVLLHDYQAGTPQERPYFLEFWDIGGSQSHRNVRSIFYQNGIDGVVLVHDLSNKKSHDSLTTHWLTEMLDALSSGNWSSTLLPRSFRDRSLSPQRTTSMTTLLKKTSSTALPMTSAAAARRKHKISGSFDPETCIGDCDFPFLVVGTKQDQVEKLTGGGGGQQSSISSNSLSPVAAQCNADEIKLDTRQSKALGPGSTNALKLSKFFDKVIEQRHFRNKTSSSNLLANNTLPKSNDDFFTDRRRKFL